MSEAIHAYERLQWPTHKDINEAWNEFYESTPVTAREVLGRLGVILSSDFQEEPPRPGHHSELIFTPIRLAVVAIGSQVDKDERVNLVQRIADFTQDTYAGRSSERDVLDLEEIFASHGLLDRAAVVHDPFHDEVSPHRVDWKTRVSTNPAMANQAAQHLVDEGFSNAYLLALGNGGYAAGTLTSLELEKKTGQPVRPYFVRFSQRKNRDTQPNATHEELEYIEDQSKGRPLVIFDEDTASGKTIDEAVKYFKHRMPHQMVVGLSANDRRDSKEKFRQGVWWERSYSGINRD